MKATSRHAIEQSAPRRQVGHLALSYNNLVAAGISYNSIWRLGVRQAPADFKPVREATNRHIPQSVQTVTSLLEQQPTARPAEGFRPFPARSSESGQVSAWNTSEHRSQLECCGDARWYVEPFVWLPSGQELPQQNTERVDVTRLRCTQTLVTVHDRPQHQRVKFNALFSGCNRR